MSEIEVRNPAEPPDTRRQQCECLHDYFEQTAGQYPKNVAISCDGLFETYEELNARANRLARRLRSLGIGPGSRVALYLPRSALVYPAMLAVLKSGAAYVPIDHSYPADRVRFILDDSNARLLLSTSDCAAACGSLPAEILCLDKGEHDRAPGFENFTRDDVRVTGGDIAYVIYTSGTTGRPKGILVPHRCASALVSAERALFGVQATDRVFQGFSLAFDASIEEIWLAFASGASLEVGTEETIHSGAELAAVLNGRGVTVFSCVPTMLSLLADNLPTVRLLIVGGESCPRQLVDRWCRAGRRMVNTYGPTETTVIATAAECIAGEPVTIGRPIQGYCVYVLDRFQKPLPAGIAGELCIGGEGVAAGYLNQPELTEQKFIEATFALAEGVGTRLFRSGDLGRINEQGNIEFLGRIDTQVKLRGFRVELEEVEAQLMHCSGVSAAAVAVRKDSFGIESLVAYVIPRAQGSFDEAESRARLRDRLAPFMVPTVYMVVDKFPRLASGKVDRAHLPVPPAGRAAEIDVSPAATATEANLLSIWSRLFAPNPVSVTDDFFDLGGHSLLAAQMVSELRRAVDTRKLSVREIYSHRTVRELAARIDASKTSPGHLPAPQARAATADDEQLRHESRRWYPWCGAIQAGAIAVQYAVLSALFLLPAGLVAFGREIGFWSATLAAMAAVLGYVPLSMLVAVAAKWLLIGRFSAGSYPLWGPFYIRLWTLGRILSLVPVSLMAGTPLLVWYYRCLGSRIGRDVYCGTTRLAAFDLIEIGDRSSISREAALLGYSIDSGIVRVGPISVGNRCYVGPRSVLCERTTMGDGSSLGELSLLPADSIVPGNQSWRGSPASPEVVAAGGPEQGLPTLDRPAAAFSYYLASISAFVLVLLLPVVLATPLVGILYEAFTRYGFLTALGVAIPCSAVYVMLFCLVVAAVKALILPSLPSGRFSTRSMLYTRKWIVDTFMQMSLRLVQPLYATVFLASWLRLMAARIGKRSEISTVNQLTTDQLTIGDESFLADSASIGAPVVHEGFMHVVPTTVGRRSFIGNSAVLAAGSRVEDGTLIGVLSTPPGGDAARRPGCSWLGSPPMFLPKRQESASYPDRFTFSPTPARYAARGSIEFFKIVLPTAFAAAIPMLFYALTGFLASNAGTAVAVVAAPLTLFVSYLVAPAAAIAFKWVLVGRYRPRHKPLWSTFVWRNELINSLCENLAHPSFVGQFLGTPFAPFFFRCMGSRMGKRVYLASTEITEFDLVKIGDDAAINIGSTLQTHLFEDRIMKMSRISIGSRCVVGPLSVVLYDSEMEPGSRLGSLSLLMKGETLPGETTWEGSPCRRVSQS